MMRRLYWGDIHNHCGISYGQGSLENALAAARQHLDFCSVTGHASWHDMPHRTKGFEFVVDYQNKGFAKLAGNWDTVRQAIEAAGDMLDGGRGAHLQSFPSEAFLVHRAVPQSRYHFKGEWSDAERETSCDTYDVEVRQTNDQYAWLSPVFVLS